MPFREKLKRAFSSNSPPTSKTASPTISQADGPRWPSNVYRPDEPMPRPKYRAPVKKEHKQKLDSFSFGTSWRRMSHVSMHSPMGSRAPSRRNSRMSRRSASGTSIGLGRESMDARRRSLAFADRPGATSRSSSISAQPITRPLRQTPWGTSQFLKTEPELDDDDDVANVGLSRINTYDSTTPATPKQKHNLPSTRTDHSQSRPPVATRTLRLATDNNNHSISSADSPSPTTPKQDSGPPSQYLDSGSGLAIKEMFTDEDLAFALQRSEVGAYLAAS